MNFIKKIFQDGADEAAHKQFTRFGKGEYGRRALLSLWRTKFVKVKGSFEFANGFVLFVAGLESQEKFVFNGNIWSKEPIENLAGGVKKQGKWIYNVKGVPAGKIKELEPFVYYFLLNADGPGIKLRTKAKIPKPGKGENKVDDKFCQMELDNRYYNAVRSDFFWDLPDSKKANVEHRFIIEEIVVPQDLKDEKNYAKIREAAKRKGKIIREAEADGRKFKSEKSFEV